MTEPIEVEFHTDHSDQYAPAGVRIFMNDSYTFFSTGQIPDVWYSKSNNNKQHKMQHFDGLLLGGGGNVEELEREVKGFQGIKSVSKKKLHDFWYSVQIKIF